MDQKLIDRLVATATGESVCFIHRYGFQHANPAEVEFDPEPIAPNTLQFLFANTAVALMLGSWLFSPKISIKSAGPTVERIQELADLIVLRLQVADVLYNDDESGAKMAMLVRGDCDLVVDLNNAKIIECDPEKQIATIQLPMPRATRPRVDHERTRVYKIEKTGLARIIPWQDPRGPLYEEGMKEAQKLIEFQSSKVEELERAKRHAQSVITLFFGQFDWNVEIKWEG